MDEARWEQLEARLRALEARLARIEASPEPGPPIVASAQPADPRVSPPAAPVLASSAPPPPPGRAQAPLAQQAARWPAAPGAAQPAPAAEGVVASAPVPSTWGQTPGAPSAPRARPSLRELEERFAGRALAWAGGLALVAAAIFFMSLAFSRGWINEPLRVLIGLFAGCAALVGGGVFLDRRNRLIGNVLAAVGLGVISVSLFAATRLYGLIPPELGLLAALVTVMAAAALAIRFDAREVAAFGLVAALVAPLLVGGPPTALTLAFLAVTLIGTTVIAIFRSWRWLPVIAFVLTAPQLASWLGSGPDPLEGLVVLAGFWLVTAIAAAGEEFRIQRDDLRPSSAVLVVANAAFLVWGGFVVLTGDLATWRGAFILLAALAHLGLGGWFLRRQGLGHLYGNLVAATGVALVTLAAFVQLGAAVVPVAWSAEGVALTWLAVRRRHRWSAAEALILGGLAALHLVAVEFPLGTVVTSESTAGIGPSAPFAVLTLAAVLAAAAVVAALVPSRLIRSALAGTGILLVAWAIPFELGATTMVAAWVLLLPVGVVIDDGLRRLTDDPAIARLTKVRLPIQPATIAGAIAWSVAAAYALNGPLSPLSWGAAPLPTVPFRDDRTLVATLLVVSAVAAARWTRVAAFRRIAIGAAVVVAAILAPFEIDAAGVVVVWVGLALVAILAAWRDPGAELPYTWLGVVLMGAAVVVALVYVAPPGDLVVTEGGAPLPPGWPLAFAAIAVGLFAAPRHPPLAPWTTWLQVGAGIALVYAISIGVVSVFQGMVGGSTATEELAKQAQVAMSVCWTAIGVLGLIVGMVWRRPMVRQAGLVLIGLATAKVFIIDLASMDVAYRALVLAGLGVLLLLSAWLFTRFRAPRDSQAGAPPLPPGA